MSGPQARPQGEAHSGSMAASPAGRRPEGKVRGLALGAVVTAASGEPGAGTGLRPKCPGGQSSRAGLASGAPAPGSGSGSGAGGPRGGDRERWELGLCCNREEEQAWLLCCRVGGGSREST